MLRRRQNSPLSMFTVTLAPVPPRGWQKYSPALSSVARPTGRRNRLFVSAASSPASLWSNIKPELIRRKAVVSLMILSSLLLLSPSNCDLLCEESVFIGAWDRSSRSSSPTFVARSWNKMRGFKYNSYVQRLYLIFLNGDPETLNIFGSTFDNPRLGWLW